MSNLYELLDSTSSAGDKIKKPPQVHRGLWPAARQLRCPTLFNLIGTFFTTALAGIITVRRVLLGRILLVRALSALLRRVLLGLVRPSSGI